MNKFIPNKLNMNKFILNKLNMNKFILNSSSGCGQKSRKPRGLAHTFARHA